MARALAYLCYHFLFKLWWFRWIQWTDRASPAKYH